MPRGCTKKVGEVLRVRKIRVLIFFDTKNIPPVRSFMCSYVLNVLTFVLLCKLSSHKSSAHCVVNLMCSFTYVLCSFTYLSTSMFSCTNAHAYTICVHSYSETVAEYIYLVRRFLSVFIYIRYDAKTKVHNGLDPNRK